MNVYHVGKCPHCGEPVVTPYDGGSDEMSTIMVHGAHNLLEAEELLRSGQTMSQIAPLFCGYCGNKMPCGCGKPSPQELPEER